MAEGTSTDWVSQVRSDALREVYLGLKRRGGGGQVRSDELKEGSLGLTTKRGGGAGGQ